MLTRYEESILGKLDAFGAMRKLVREKGPEVVHLVEADDRDGGLLNDALGSGGHTDGLPDAAPPVENLKDRSVRRPRGAAVP